MLRQVCDDANDPGLIENNEVASEWGSNPFWKDSIVFNQTVSLASSQHCPSVDADAQCKQGI